MVAKAKMGRPPKPEGEKMGTSLTTWLNAETAERLTR